MKHIAYLKNTVQKYSWGSFTAIPELTGKTSPADEPQAELWMGAHPKAPSFVSGANGMESLEKLIHDHPVDILGREVAEVFDGKLPYLFKVLAAAQPLSIQAHPDVAAARDGYAREEMLGIPFDDPNRNYKDPRHKPECLCALTPFWGLCGFRRASESASLLRDLCPQTLGNLLDRVENKIGEDRIKALFRWVMTRDRTEQIEMVTEAVGRAGAERRARFENDWIVRLNQVYPYDIGAIFPAILNLVCLQPGEALFLGPGELHAYLEGVGLEIMANSDNVLRGGLTTKHMDVDELMAILSFKEKTVEILLPEKREKHLRVYRTPAPEFELSVITLDAGDVYAGQAERSVEILFCIAGDLSVSPTGGLEALHLNKGASILIPAAVPGYVVEGEGVIYKASVPMGGNPGSAF
jgi:mannose-6-phosphate isomerase